MGRCQLSLCLAMLALAGTEAYAADGGKDKKKDHYALEEVIVTAEKRVETEQDVAASFNVYDSQKIEDSKWDNVTDVADTVPSIAVIGVTKTRTSVYVRGIGTNKYDIGTEGSVGVFVDGIYVPRFSSIMQNLVDIERVEILKGPQGTLYGRNTIGGAISIYTKDPNNHFSGTVTGELGNEDSHFLATSLSGALIKDELFASVSGATRETGGFRTELNSGHHDDESLRTGRAKLLYKPTDTFTAKLTYDYTDQFVNSFTGEPILPAGASIFLLSPTLPQPPFPFGLELPNARKQIDVVRDIAEEASDMYTNRANMPGFTDLNASAANLNLTWESDDLIVESVTGARDEKTNELVDDDRMKYDLSFTLTNQKSKTWSQEFKISSAEGGKYTMDDKLRWLGGIYIYHDDAERRDYAELGKDTIVYGLMSFLAWLPTGTPIDFGQGPLPTGADAAFTVPIAVDWNVDVVTKSVALFGEVTYAWTDELSTTLGLRSSDDKKDYGYTEKSPGNEHSYLFREDNFSFRDNLNYSSVDPKLVMEYTPEQMTDTKFYGSYTQGYKSGGIQFLARREDTARQSFDKEQLASYEVGMKSRWLKQKLQWNSSLYHYDYKNLQIQQIAEIMGNVQTITDNAGMAKVNGLETDLQYLFTADWFVQFSYSHMDATFDEFKTIDSKDYSGNVMAASPKDSFWISSDYTFKVISEWYATTRVDYSWRAKHAFDAQNNFFEDAYGIVNSSVKLMAPNDALSFTLYCTNCADQEFLTNVIPLTTKSGWGATGERRRVALAATYKFD